MNALVDFLTSAAGAAAIGSFVTGAFIVARQLQVVRHLSDSVPADVAHALIDLAHAANGKFIDHVPTLLHDAEAIVNDVHPPVMPAPANPVQVIPEAPHA